LHERRRLWSGTERVKEGIEDMSKVYEGNITGAGRKFAIVISRFNEFVSVRLLEGAMDCLFDIPAVAKRMGDSGSYDAVVCLGVVIRGATPHFDYVASEVAKGVANVAADTGVPAVFGVVTADSLEQAIERAGSKSGNRGWDAAQSAMELADLYASMK
jgi:6,7-dimethyl-8-ribityllumazine synthase